MFTVSSVVKERTVTSIFALAYARTWLTVFTRRWIACIERYNNMYTIHALS